MESLDRRQRLPADLPEDVGHEQQDQGSRNGRQGPEEAVSRDLAGSRRLTSVDSGAASRNESVRHALTWQR